MRYEDLLTTPYDTLIGIFKFLLNRSDDLKGTIIERRIADISCKEKPEVYKPRSGKINGNLAYFSSS